MAIVSTARTGTPFELTFDSEPDPGKPRSAEKAKHIRDPLVRQAAPQKSWPMVEIRTTDLAAAGVSARKRSPREEPAASLTPSASWTANMIASSTIQPMSAE